MINVLRWIFIVLDSVIYGLLEIIFQLIMDLANFQLFRTETINSFANRIYLILGIVMVFKLMISFIQILINPDKMDDKEQGVGGVLKRVIISLILIVMVRPIFDMARDLQKYVLPIIPKVILATPVDLSNEEVASSTGQVMAYYSFLPFFYYSDPECNNGHLWGTSDDDSLATITRVADAVGEVNEKKCPQASDGYTYNYRFFISTIVGAYLVYVLVTVALKIAIRAIKFSLCEIIAPVPIASYIDPKASKESFDKWVSTSVKVYIDLFTRLMVVYFIIYIFLLLFNSPDGGLTRFSELVAQYNGDTVRALLVTLFIIVGLLNFAKEMPKFVSDMLGVKDGFSDIGDMFKGAGWKSLGGAVGAVSNTASAGLSAFNYSKKFKGESRGTALRRAAGALVSSGGRSIGALANGKGFAGTKDAKEATMSNVRRTVNTAKLREADKIRYDTEVAANGGSSKGITPAAGSIRGMIHDAWTEFSGTPLPTSKSYHDAASLMNRGKSEIFGAAKTKITEKPFEVTYSHSWTDTSGTHSKTWAEILGAMKEAEAGKEISDIELRSLSRSQLEDLYGNAWKNAAAKYIDEVHSAANASSSKNSTLYNKIDQWQMEYDNNTIISKDDKNKVDTKLGTKSARKYGDFFKASDDFGGEFETTSRKLSDIEEAKKGDKS